MNSFLRKTISKLYKAVSTAVAATRDVLSKRLQAICETASLLYNRMMKNMRYGWERLKDIMEKEAEEEARKQQQEPASAAQEQNQDDDEQYDTIAKIKLVNEVKSVKEFRVTGNLNKTKTKMI